jgi:D-aspartate ligase
MVTNVDAIILGLGINGLAVVRSLGVQGLKIGGVFNEAKDEVGIYSKYLISSKYFNVSDAPNSLYNICLSLIGDQKEKAVLICTTDLFSEFVASNSLLFKKRFIITTPNNDLYWKFLNKQPTAKICIDKNLKIPVTFFVENGGNLLDKCKDLLYPAIIKPNLTFEKSFPGKVIVVKKKYELEEFIKEYPELESKVVVQEIIPSGDGKLFIVSTFSDSEGIVRAIFTGKKVRSYLPDFGVTSYGISCSCEKLKDTTTNFLNEINYTGFADLEFAYDEYKNEYYFIELNIRTSYLNQLYKDSGIDLNYIAYLSSIDKDYSHLLMDQKDGVRWIDFTRDLGSCYRKIKDGKISFHNCFFDILKSRSFAHLSFKDLNPFYISIIQFLLIKINKFKRSR